MKRIVLFFICLFALQYSMAQNNSNLSYSEIDSILKVYEKKKAYEKGIQLSLEASQRSGKEDSLCGAYLDMTAYFYELNGEKAKAIEYYKKTLEVFAKALGSQSLRYATTLNFFAMFYESIGSYELALPLYIQALSITEEKLGKEDALVATVLNNLAVLHNSMGNYELALPLYIRTIKIKEKVFGKEHASFIVSLNNLATAHQNMGNYELALPLFLEIITIQKKTLGNEHPNLARSFNNLAVLHKKMGNNDLTLSLYLQVKSIYEKTLGEEHPYFATSLNNLASLYSNMGKEAQALPLYLQANKILEKTLGDEHPSFAVSLNTLVALYTKMGNYEKALPLVVQAHKILEKTLGEEHPNYATSLNTLAGLHMRMGNYDLALSLHRQATNIYEKTLGKGHLSFITGLINQASSYRQMGNYAKTWELFGQAMNSSSNIQVEHTFNKVWLDSLKGAPYSSTLHLDKMVRILSDIYWLLPRDSTVIDPLVKQIYVTDLATALLSRAKSQVANERDKLQILAQSNGWLLRSLEVLGNEDKGKAFLRADQSKSVLLLQATKSEATYRLGALPDSLMQIDKKNLKKQSQLQANLVERRSEEEKDSLRNELNQVNQAIVGFVKMIKEEHPKYYHLKYQQLDVKAEAIQELLDEETALLEYVIGDSVIHIFCVDQQQVQWKQTFVKYEILRTRIKKMHDALSNYKTIVKDKKTAYRAYTEQAYWFYQNLIAPVLANQTKIKNLILVTDGALGHLPFETFLQEQAPQEITTYHELDYLVRDYNISYNYAASLWKENVEAPQPKNNGEILGLAANYNMKLDSSLMKMRLPADQSLRNELEPLPDARKEVELLQENYQGFFAFDSLASERVVKQNAGDYAILHFATHGILNANRPMLSSLAFTEDNDSIESNFWQAHEISKMELNANLVVLSACETGFGKFEAGNGIASLARAFMYAGASSLIVSLWQVNDYATSEIMKHLYTNIAEGMKIDEALRQAKLQYMKSAEGMMAHPAFWSSFIQIGNTKPVYIKTKGGTMPWLIGAGLLLLAILGFVVTRRKKELT